MNSTRMSRATLMQVAKYSADASWPRETNLLCDSKFQPSALKASVFSTIVLAFKISRSAQGFDLGDCSLEAFAAVWLDACSGAKSTGASCVARTTMIESATTTSPTAAIRHLPVQEKRLWSSALCKLPDCPGISKTIRFGAMRIMRRTTASLESRSRKATQFENQRL